MRANQKARTEREGEHARPVGPLVVDVRRSSLDDGPGIRSVVFFKGCPLRCVWCQNPESLSARAELQREPARCTGCGGCTAACPASRARPAAEQEPGAEDGACRRCGACVEACPSAARRIAGRRYSVAALADLLLRDEPFYRRSGGGVTLSGGEPAANPTFAGALAAALRAASVHVLIETSGLFPWRAFARSLLPHLSAVYFDLKLADDEEHRRFTGQGNRRIHENLRSLAAARGPTELLPRVPLVPGITDSRDNLLRLAALVSELGLAEVRLLPYNPLWIPKRRALGLDLPYSHASWMSRDEIERCESPFREAGLTVSS